MKTALILSREIDPIEAIRSNTATPEQRQAYCLQFVSGSRGAILAAQLERQTDFIETQPAEKSGQFLMF